MEWIGENDRDGVKLFQKPFHVNAKRYCTFSFYGVFVTVAG